MVLLQTGAVDFKLIFISGFTAVIFSALTTIFLHLHDDPALAVDHQGIMVITKFFNDSFSRQTEFFWINIFHFTLTFQGIR